jgi:tetratricopeptide (TPR) repeat protein
MSAQIRHESTVPSDEAIRHQLNRIIKSECFARSERMKRFLRHIVEEELAGRNGAIKEYSIGLNVYDKPPEFDPRIDPIVRVEARRLRQKLHEFYSEEGLQDHLVISLPKNRYVPQYMFRRPVPAAARMSDLDGRNLFFKGRYLWNKRTVQDVREAIDCFSRVLSLRPDFAIVRASLAECYATLAWLECFTPESVWPKAKAAAEAALTLDPALAEAHNTLACEKALFAFDWAGAEACFQKATAINSIDATAHHWYGIFCLAPQRRFEEAVLELERATELEPCSAVIRCHLGRIQYFRRDYDEAIRQLHLALQLDPTFYLSHWALGFAYAQICEVSRAESAFVEAYELSKSPLSLSGMAYVFGLSGRHNRVEEALATMQRLPSHPGYLSPINQALIKISCGDYEAAIERLAVAVRSRAPRSVHTKVDPAFDPLKTDIRFPTLLKLMNL